MTGNFQEDFLGQAPGGTRQCLGWEACASCCPAAPWGQPRWASGSRDPGGTPGLPKGLVEICFMPSKMPPKSGHCCGAVVLMKNSLFLMKTRSMRNFPWAVQLACRYPLGPSRVAGRAMLCGATRKEGGDGPVLAGWEWDSAWSSSAALISLLGQCGMPPHQGGSSHSSAAGASDEQGRGSQRGTVLS